jgi:hypothetical protein
MRRLLLAQAWPKGKKGRNQKRAGLTFDAMDGMTRRRDKRP